jgi:hypothetical protein
MKNKLFLYIALVLTAFLFACEKEIEFNGDEIKTKLVLNGLLSPDSTVKINLSESRFFLDDNPIKIINNATVDLWKDGIKIENLSNTGAGNYVGTYIPKIGDNIRITASCDGLDPVESSTEIVTPTPIISVDTINFREERVYFQYHEDEIIYIDSSSYFSMINFDMDITFKDPKDIPNYYNINLYLKFYYSDGDSSNLQINYLSNDLVFQKVNNGIDILEDNGYLESTLFNDDLLDGKEYKLKIKTNGYNEIGIYYSNYGDQIVRREIIVELQSLSYSYYMYMKTRDANLNMNDLFEYFTEPIQIYTNIKGGIGILGSYSSSVYVIPLN